MRHSRRHADSSCVRPARDEQDLQSARMYYVSQYERAGRHETNRLAFSSYVLAASFVALGLVASPAVKQGSLGFSEVFSRAAVTTTVALANVFAILFAFRSRYWVRIHHIRVRSALEYLSPDLVTLQHEADKSAGRRKSDLSSAHSHIYQSGIHVLVIIAALAVGVFG